MLNSNDETAPRPKLEPAVMLSALAVWAALSLVAESSGAMQLLLLFGVIHLGALAAATYALGLTRARVELVSAVVLPSVAAAVIDRQAAAVVEPIGAGLALAACLLHVGLCLEHATRRRPRLATTATEPSRAVSAPVRRQSFRTTILV